jgi:LacI family transcriptional regulator, gluconate utilization system Gnt-I transcriptional repressor
LKVVNGCFASDYSGRFRGESAREVILVDRRVMRSATIRDVAAHAQVSIMTVSRAFSAPDTVAVDTLKRIEDAADAAGYVPHRLAGGLKSGVSNLVAAIVPSLENSLFAEFLQGLADGLAPAGFLLTAGDGRHHVKSQGRLISEYLSLSPRALVLHETDHAPGMPERLERVHVPVIEVGDLVEHPIQHNISFSNKAAAEALTRHMLGIGRRRIAYLTLAQSSSARSRARLIGHSQALHDAGFPFDPTLIFESAGGYAAAVQHAMAMLAADQMIDAIIGAGDVFAIGALLACRKMGIRVPDDVAIASFDDHAICREMAPGITALSIPRREIGLKTASLIVELGHVREPADPVRLDLGFELIVRESTGIGRVV